MRIIRTLVALLIVALGVASGGVLAQALENDLNVERALRTYERDRLEKTATLLVQGRRTARIMRTTNPVACWIREVVLRLIPVKPFVRVFVRINRRAGTDIVR